MKKLALHRRDGSVRAFALVDDEDYESLARWRWSADADGYAIRTWRDADGRGHTVRMHRAVLGLQLGDPRLVDHINRDRLDNRKQNLRFTDRIGSAQNRGPRTRNHSSRFRGVSFVPATGHWIARVRLGNPGTLHNLGTYLREEDAADAAARFREEHMPFAVEGERCT